MKLRINFFINNLLVVFVLITVGFGCATQKKSLLLPEESGSGLVEIKDPKQFPYFRDDYDRDSLLQTIDHSLEYFARAKSNKYGFRMQDFSHATLKETLEFFRNGVVHCNNDAELNDFIAENFRVFQAVGKRFYGDVHFTGYGTPIYQGSLTPTSEFKYPLYKKPANFRKPYFTRREIEENNLLKGNEIVYLRSKLDVYLIHVQGSAQIDILSGQKLYVGYAADSGHEYTSIGQQLILDGKIPEDELTLSTLLSYFDQHPDELDFYINKNDRFIFFEQVNYAIPHGCIGVPVTPMRSIATDKKLFPAGGLAFVVLESKKAKKTGWFRKRNVEEKLFFVSDQDSGSAIQTPARADIYFGIGERAMFEAGSLNTYGRLYYLLKR
ncbi:MAG: murein transglycosylase [Candidatus Kuenenia sp.]|nr:murein transglycosylase [Candidatus Kuenenia hertensis]